MMLFCTCNVGERIMIGDKICLTVLAIRGPRVRLGFSAPAEISIQRAELLPPDPQLARPQRKERGKHYELPRV